MPAPPGEPAPIAGQGYELVWEDDFEGTSINDVVWQPPPWYESTFQWSQITVADSVLTMTADTTPTAGRPFIELWTCGQSSPSYPHRPNALAWEEGYFEFRARAFTPSGLPEEELWIKLTLWFMSLESVNCWPDARDTSQLNVEWDMCENGVGGSGADVEHVSILHRNTGGPSGVPDTSRNYQVAGTNLLDWHVWSGRWTGNQMSTYLDGTLLGSQPTYDSSAQKQCIVLSSAALGQAPPGASASPPEFIVTELDYVRVWQRPQGRASRCAARLPGVSNAWVTTPDHPSLRITGDIDIRAELSLDDWTPAGVTAIVNRATGANWSYDFAVRTNGALRLTWSADGTATIGPDSNAIPPLVNGQRIAIRVTLDVDNGASQRVVTYYTAPSIKGPWTQLGTPITTAGVTSIFAGTRLLELGTRSNIELMAGYLYAVEVRDGIDGTVVAHADFTDKTPGMTSFTDETGKIYTVNGTAAIVPGIPKSDLYRTASPLRLA